MTEFWRRNPERKKEKNIYLLTNHLCIKMEVLVTVYMHVTNLSEVQIPFIQVFIAALQL